MPVLMSPVPTTTQTDIDLIVHANHWNPFSVLGIHELEAGPSGVKRWVVRAFLPQAKAAWVIDLIRGEPGELVPMETIHEDGFFVALFADRSAAFPYRIRVEDHQG
ncbi:MAG TPA: 1,4-alpha-glucan branching enzyme, partial [Isosphaeraceae bacterium]|nr:1,4-alpha-glucan branching enzyme [Isosphaeraceae bacterium]